MFKSLAVVVAVITSLAWFADEASARPWLNRYDYYYGSGSAPRASANYGPYSPGYRVVPPGSAYYNRFSPGYLLVPPGSYYYSPAYPPAYDPSYPTYSNNWYSFKW